MTLDDIFAMWEADCSIDENQLATASITTAKLHSKYLRLYIDYKLKKTKLLGEYNTIRKTKFRYYRGEMSYQELKELGWEQWQYNKPLKSEMDEFLTGDTDLAKLQTRIDYIDTIISAVESIMTQIKARDWQIRNAIEFKKFLAGS